MNTVTLGVRLRKAALKTWTLYERQCNELETPCTLSYTDFLERERKQLITSYLEGQRTVNMMKEAAITEGLITTTTTQRHYFITIRPDTRKIDFDSFYELVKTYVNRKCFHSYRLSFEQKGTTTETLGDGFHVHVIAHMTQRSKTEVLRDTISTFKGCTADNCIDVQLTKNPDDIVEKYLINYDADDGHKKITHEWDVLWRQAKGIASLYDNNIDARIMPLALSSPSRLVAFD